MPCPRSPTFSSVLSCRSFIVLHFIVRSVIYLFFVKGVRSGSRSTLLHVDVQLLQQNSLKRHYFFHCIFFHMYLHWQAWCLTHSINLIFVEWTTNLQICFEAHSFTVVVKCFLYLDSSLNFLKGFSFFFWFIIKTFKKKFFWIMKVDTHGNDLNSRTDPSFMFYLFFNLGLYEDEKRIWWEWTDTLKYKPIEFRFNCL